MANPYESLKSASRRNNLVPDAMPATQVIQPVRSQSVNRRRFEDGKGANRPMMIAQAGINAPITHIHIA